MAWAAVLASLTTHISGDMLSDVCKPIRTMKWSSTINIRIFSFLMQIGSRDMFSDWQRKHNFGAGAGHTSDFQRPSNFLRPLPHAEQPKMAWGRAGGVFGIKAAAVVLH